eukprot:2118624-Amphidinium_carterae.4
MSADFLWLHLGRCQCYTFGKVGQACACQCRGKSYIALLDCLCLKHSFRCMCVSTHDVGDALMFYQEALSCELEVADQALCGCRNY